MKKIRSWLLYSLGFIVVALMLWDFTFSEHGYFVFEQERSALVQFKDEIKQLSTEKERLNTEIIRLRDDPKALEEVVHRELGYVYPDEYMLIMPTKNQNNNEIKGSEDE